MSAQPLAFAQILAGSVLLTAGISGHSIPEVLAGDITPLKPIVSDLPIPDAGAAETAGSTGSAGGNVDASLFTAGAAGSSGGKYPAGSLAESVATRIAKVNAAHPSYSWGGGHGSKPAKLGVPVDCSGFVSQVLKVNPRVSGEFARWGSAGKSTVPGAVNVYSNSTHVFMSVVDAKGKEHFAGTSSTNPGGGAGWIPANVFTSAYVKGFTVRHSA